MLHEIAPHVFSNAFAIRKPLDTDIVLCYRENQILLRIQESNYKLPFFSEFTSDAGKHAEYAFSIDSTGFFLVDEEDIILLEGYSFQPIRMMRQFQPDWCAFAGITGSQLYRFKESRKFCGRCGTHTLPCSTERAYVCPECGQIEYPKISPAIIVAIVSGNHLLMTKYAKGEYKKYGLVAGFVEFGESFEEAVKREVLEEVGLHVKNVQYYKSQPWPFSDSEMVGFFAELDGEDKITLQESELEEAVWFEREDIPVNPGAISIGQELIEKVRSKEYKKYMSFKSI